MKTKSFTLCALAIALSACGGSSGSDNSNNLPGIITLSGTPLEGQSLTANVSDPDGIDANAIQYQWRAGTTTIAGATNANYVLTSDEVGRNISVVAQYTDNGGVTEILLSSPTEEVARLVTNTEGELLISGGDAVGTSISANVTDANGAGNDITYTWMLDGEVIADQTSTSLTIVEAYIGQSISAMASYTDNDGFAENIASNIIIARAANAAGTALITGNAIAGNVLTVSVTDDNMISNDISYQWQANGEDIADATSATYTTLAAQIGQAISAVVAYTDDDGYSENVTASAVTVLPLPAVNTQGTVVISGDTVAGSTLSSLLSDINGVSGNVSYTWLSNGQAIAGANANTFSTTSARVGESISLMASYTDNDGFMESLSSNAIVVTAVPAINVVGNVSITGTGVSGSNLVANVVDANTISSAIVYTWRADGMVISGASSNTLTVTDGLVDMAITVTVNYTDDDGFAESASSNAITALPVPVSNVVGTITVSGQATVGSVLSAAVLDNNGATGSISYSWMANGLAIAGANAASFTLTSAQAGQTITVMATYVDDAGFSENITSSASAAVIENSLGSISISGNTNIGDTLSATLTDSNGVPATIAYTWLADGNTIAGESTDTFVISAAQAGQVITVMAEYTDENGFDESVVSNPTATIPTNTIGTISIAGTASSGETLTATLVDGNGASNTITYEWMADSVAIAGANTSSFVLSDAQIGQQISIMASYTDDNGFVESVTSALTSAIIAAAVNSPATLVMNASSTIIEGQLVTTTLSDANGTTNAASYTWMADGITIAGATSSQYAPGADDRGKLLSVSVSYTDDDGFSENVSASADAIVYSVITNSLSDLVSAAGSLLDGDVIGLASGDYANASTSAVGNEIEISVNNVLITRTSSSTASISGPTCIVISGNNNIIDGLAFANIDMIVGSSCESNGDSSLYVAGNTNIVRNTTFDSENPSRTIGDQYNWMTVKGVNNTITRNLFTGASDNFAVTRGAVISVFSNATVGDQEDHVISYNLFKDFGTAGSDPGSPSRDGNAIMVQLGRSTGVDSNANINAIVEFNLFTNVNLDRRMVKVQSGGNIIRNNTIRNGSGMISLEDGQNNTATNNIIISDTADNSDDGGISFGPYGHTITNNYIAGLRTTSGDRAGIHLNHRVLSNTGNQNLSISAVTVANNSIFNSREAIEFGSSSCVANSGIMDFDNNLVANDEAGDNLGLQSNGSGREAIQDDCALNSASDFDNNHLYSRTITNSGGAFFTLFADASGNVTGDEEDADLIQNNNGLWESQGVDAGVGADVSQLSLLTEADVGPNTN